MPFFYSAGWKNNCWIFEKKTENKYRNIMNTHYSSKEINPRFWKIWYVNQPMLEKKQFLGLLEFPSATYDT